MKLKIWILVLVLALTTAGCGDKGPATAPEHEEKVVKVATVSLGQATRNTTLSGVLAPIEEAAVGFEVSGRLTDVIAKEGDQVTNGQVLARVNAVQVAQASSGLDKARVGYRQAKDSYERVLQLYKSGALSRVDLDGARDQLAIAERDLALAEQAHSLVGGSGGASEAVLRSPLAGTVISKNAAIGQLVSPGTPV